MLALRVLMPASCFSVPQVGSDKMTPVQCYLDVEGIVKLAQEQKVDVIHPGWVPAANSRGRWGAARPQARRFGPMDSTGWRSAPPLQRPPCSML